MNKSWRQHPIKQQLYGHLQRITKTIIVRHTRHAGHSWRSKDELKSVILLWAPSHGRAKAGRPDRTYVLIQDIALKTSWVVWEGQGDPCWQRDMMMMMMMICFLRVLTHWEMQTASSMIWTWFAVLIIRMNWNLTPTVKDFILKVK